VANAVWSHPEGQETASDYPATRAGLQGAIDNLAAGRGRVLVVGEIEIDEPISLHSNCHLAGLGFGMSVIKRADNSFTGTSPAQFANMLISSEYGSNGTLSTSSTPQENISVTGLTIDGNYANNTVTFTSPGLVTGHYGIKFQYVMGVHLHDLVIKNLLQTGVDLVSCGNARCSDLHIASCGKYAAAASRNSFNFNNGTSTALADGYARDLVLTNLVSEDAKDTNITLKNVMDVSISNCTFDGAKIGIEIESTNSTMPLQGNFNISNITSRNQNMNFIRFSPLAGTGIENVNVSNCTCDLHPTDHGNDTATAHSAALFFGRTNDAYFKHLTVSDVTVRNINSFQETTEVSMLYFNLPGTTQSEHITFRNVKLFGANGATFNNDNHGFEIQGHVAHLTLDGCHVQDAESNGYLIGPDTTGKECRDVRIRGCSVDGAQADGFKILTAVDADIARVDVSDCTTKDCAIGTSARGFIVGVSAASGGSCNDVAIRGGRIAQTSGAISGVEVYQNGTGVVDNILLENIDVSDIGGGGTPFRLTGTPTNIDITYAVRRSPNITAASSITLLPGTFSHISGNTTIDNIVNSAIHEGREITLFTTGTPTIKHNSGGTGNIRCTGAADLVMAANSMVKFVSVDGTLWRQSGPQVTS